VAARDQLIAAGIDVGEFLHIGTDGRVGALDPERRTYRSRASFSYPDGHVWLLQRLPGHVDSGVTSFGSASDLASALRRAAAAHGKHEKRIGEAELAGLVRHVHGGRTVRRRAAAMKTTT